MVKLKLTQRTVETLRVPAAGRVEIRDASLPNFVLRVGATGRKTFTYVYRLRGEQRRAELGTYPPLTLGEARDMARQVWAEVQRGNDPDNTLPWLQNRRMAVRSPVAEHGAFAALCRDYLADRKPFLRTSTHQLYARLIRQHIVPTFGALDPPQVTRGKIREWLEGLKATPTQANRAMAVMKLVCAWAMDEERLEASPCAGIKKPSPEVARTRYLTHDEIRAVFDALARERPLIAAYYEILFLTAVRRSTPLEAEWKNVDFDRALWRIPITKRARGTAEGSGRPFLMPLTRQAIASLEVLRAFSGHSRFVFPGGSPRRAQRDEDHHLHNPQKSVERIRDRSGVDFQIRDIRRTVATRMAEDLGTAPFIIAKVMDHKLPGEAQMGDVYNRYDYLAEKRQALASWAELLSKITGKASLSKSRSIGSTALR